MNGSCAMFTLRSDFSLPKGFFLRTIPIYIDNFLTEKQPVNLTRNKGYLRCGPVRAMGAMALKRRENCFDRGV